MDTPERSLRGKIAVIGVGESAYYKHGHSPEPEFKLVMRAILGAAADAGMNVKEIDGFSSYSNDRTMPARISAALGLKQLRSSVMQWGGGGGGNCAAVANGAAAIVGGLADCVVVYRGLAQGQFGRFGQASTAETVSGENAYEAPYGMVSHAQKLAMKVRRFMHDHGVKQEALRAIALASYHHAQANPRAVMHGKPLDATTYDNSRWIVEPFHLYDCCMENDGAAALIIVPAERAREFRNKPVYVLGAASGSGHRAMALAHNATTYASSNFGTLAPDLYRMAGVSPSDIGVVQSYENFTGGVLMSLVEHGLFKPEQANEVLTLENLLAPSGKLPLNTSGGNLAECYVHGFEQIVEAVRQVRGTSTSQAARHDVALVAGGPMVSVVSNLLLGSEATL